MKAELYLKNGEVAIVDAGDFERVKTFHYRLTGGEVIRTETQGGRRTTRSLKHDVLETPGAAIRHLDGDPLNNTRANLELMRNPETSHVSRFNALPPGTRRSTSIHRPASKRYSEVPGVTFRRDREGSKPWRVRIQVQGKAYYLGHYATREEAEAVARAAYNQAVA